MPIARTNRRHSTPIAHISELTNPRFRSVVFWNPAIESITFEFQYRVGGGGAPAASYIREHMDIGREAFAINSCGILTALCNAYIYASRCLFTS